MEVVDKRSFMERFTETGISFDTRYPAPQTIGFRKGNRIKISLGGEVGDIARLLGMVSKIYDSAEALWIWRRSGTWVPSKLDLDGWRGEIIQGLEALGLPLADGAVLCRNSERRLLPSVLLLLLSIQRSVDDDVFLIAADKFPVAWIDHDGDLFLDCASEEVESGLRTHFAHWL